MKRIPLGNSELVALVDDEHYEAVMRFRWRLRKGRNGVLYAHTGQLRLRNGMHNVVGTLLGIHAPLIDHRNRDGLDNQSQNLRPATHAQNGWNCARPAGASGHPGVSKNRGNWAVRFEHEGQTMYFGTHRDLDVAKRIASHEMARLRGDFMPSFVRNRSATASPTLPAGYWSVLPSPYVKATFDWHDARGFLCRAGDRIEVALPEHWLRPLRGDETPSSSTADTTERVTA